MGLYTKSDNHGLVVFLIIRNIVKIKNIVNASSIFGILLLKFVNKGPKRMLEAIWL